MNTYEVTMDTQVGFGTVTIQADYYTTDQNSNELIFYNKDKPEQLVAIFARNKWNYVRKIEDNGKN